MVGRLSERYVMLLWLTPTTGIHLTEPALLEI